MKTADDLLNERRQLVEEQRDLAEEFGEQGSRTDRAVVQFAIDDIDRQLAERHGGRS